MTTPIMSIHDAVRYRLLLATFDHDADGPADVFRVIREARHGLSALAQPELPDLDGEIKYFVGTLGELFEEGCIAAHANPPRVSLTHAGLEILCAYAKTLSPD